MTSLVPCTLISTASFKLSSNLIVAAAWKMMPILDTSVCLSINDKPKPATEQSPATVTILWRNLGTASRSRSNSWNNNSLINQNDNWHFFFLQDRQTIPRSLSECLCPSSSWSANKCYRCPDRLAKAYRWELFPWNLEAWIMKYCPMKFTTIN